MGPLKSTSDRCDSTTRPLEARWLKLKRRIEAVAPSLTTQGVIVPKPSGRGRVWVLRFRVREGGRRRLKSIHLGADGETELLARARDLLDSLRGPARWLREVAACARCARAARSLVRRLTGK